MSQSTKEEFKQNNKLIYVFIIESRNLPKRNLNNFIKKKYPIAKCVAIYQRGI